MSGASRAAFSSVAARKSSSSSPTTSAMTGKPPMLPLIKAPSSASGFDDTPVSGRSYGTPKLSPTLTPREDGTVRAGASAHQRADASVPRSFSIGPASRLAPSSRMADGDELSTEAMRRPLVDASSDTKPSLAGRFQRSLSVKPHSLHRLDPRGGGDAGSVTSDCSDGSAIRHSVSATTPTGGCRESPVGLQFTARAWSIADEATGKILLAHNPDAKLQIASITKLMTAWVVLCAAKEEPEMLSELVLVSYEAAVLTGTSATLQKGEVYTVLDLLYGMMLPSGNDAAAALAEYLGDGFSPPEKCRDRNPHPVDRFVAEMNREAARLGLSDTKFVNPHGLAGSVFHSTVRDVSKLVSVAMTNSLLKKIVSARHHTVKVRHISAGSVMVTPPGGGFPTRRTYPHTLQWTNSNQLLGMVIAANPKYLSSQRPPSSPFGGLPHSGSSNSLVDAVSRASTPTGPQREPQRYIVEGVKTGITTIAGGCLATRMRRLGGTVPGRPDYPYLVFVVLGSKDARTRFSETLHLASYALAQLGI